MILHTCINYKLIYTCICYKLYIYTINVYIFIFLNQIFWINLNVILITFSAIIRSFQGKKSFLTDTLIAFVWGNNSCPCNSCPGKSLCFLCWVVPYKKNQSWIDNFSHLRWYKSWLIVSKYLIYCTILKSWLNQCALKYSCLQDFRKKKSLLEKNSIFKWVKNFWEYA